MNTSDHSECKSLLGSLSDYVDGEFSEELCKEIESHLAECQDCRIVVDTLRKTIYLYHECAAEPVEIPASMRERLFRTLKLEDHLQH